MASCAAFVQRRRALPKRTGRSDGGTSSDNNCGLAAYLLPRNSARRPGWSSNDRTKQDLLASTASNNRSAWSATRRAHSTRACLLTISSSVPRAPSATRTAALTSSSRTALGKAASRVDARDRRSRPAAARAQRAAHSAAAAETSFTEARLRVNIEAQAGSAAGSWGRPATKRVASSASARNRRAWSSSLRWAHNATEASWKVRAWAAIDNTWSDASSSSRALVTQAISASVSSAGSSSPGSRKASRSSTSGSPCGRLTVSTSSSLSPSCTHASEDTAHASLSGDGARTAQFRASPPTPSSRGHKPMRSGSSPAHAPRPQRAETARGVLDEDHARHSEIVPQNWSAVSSQGRPKATSSLSFCSNSHGAASSSAPSPYIEGGPSSPMLTARWRQRSKRAWTQGDATLDPENAQTHLSRSSSNSTHKLMAGARATQTRAGGFSSKRHTTSSVATSVACALTAPLRNVARVADRAARHRSRGSPLSCRAFCSDAASPSGSLLNDCAPAFSRTPRVSASLRSSSSSSSSKGAALGSARQIGKRPPSPGTRHTRTQTPSSANATLFECASYRQPATRCGGAWTELGCWPGVRRGRRAGGAGGSSSSLFSGTSSP